MQKWSFWIIQFWHKKTVRQNLTIPASLATIPSFFCNLNNPKTRNNDENLLTPNFPDFYWPAESPYADGNA